MAVLIPVLLFAGAALLGGYQTGQNNPEGTPFLKSDPKIVKYEDPWK